MSSDCLSEDDRGLDSSCYPETSEEKSKPRHFVSVRLLSVTSECVVTRALIVSQIQEVARRSGEAGFLLWFLTSAAADFKRLSAERSLCI